VHLLRMITGNLLNLNNTANFDVRFKVKNMKIIISIITILLLSTNSHANEYNRLKYRIAVQDFGAYNCSINITDKVAIMGGVDLSYYRLKHDVNEKIESKTIFYKLGIRKYSSMLDNLSPFYQLIFSSDLSFVDGEKQDRERLSTTLQYGLEFMASKSVAIEGMLGIGARYYESEISEQISVNLPSVGFGVGFYFE